MVFLQKQEFVEQSVVRSDKQIALDNDATTFERMEALRSSLVGVDQNLFNQLFPGMLALPSAQGAMPLALPAPRPTSAPEPRDESSSKRKQVNTNDEASAIACKKPKVLTNNGSIVEDELPDGD